jgi:hypothetical protein
MWGSSISVTNATVWQGWNGGVINLGWANNSPGDDCLIDSVYVIKTYWNLNHTPTWTNTHLNSDNDGIGASLMTPGQNIFSPPSTFDNLNGFQIVNGSPLTGSMNIGFKM